MYFNFIDSRDNSEYVDLHIHTTASDGIMDTKDIALVAYKKGLKAIAITDHDTTEGLKNIESIDFIEIVPGIELSTTYGTEEFHILGYYIDPENLYLKKELEKFAKKRIERVKKIIEKLNYIGIDISYEEVKSFAEEGTIGRPHIARMLIEKGYVFDELEAFNRYLMPTKPAYVARQRVSPWKAIELIKASGGLAFWAHPEYSSDNSSYLVEQFVEWGIHGIEVVHPIQIDQSIQKYWEQKARENGLLVSGGTDFHGYEETLIEIGDVCIPYAYLDEIKKRLRK